MINAAVLTISDSSSAGTRADRSGPAVRERLEQLGWNVSVTEAIPDETAAIGARLAALADGGAVGAIFTTGGTGIAARDVTPEAMRAVMDREIPGFGEVMRARGREFTPARRALPLARRNARACAHRRPSRFAQRRGREPECYRGIGAPRAGAAPGADRPIPPRRIKMLRFFLWMLLCGWLLAPPSRAQQPQQPGRRPPRISVTVENMVAPVLVFDRDGNMSMACRPTSSTSSTTARNRISPWTWRFSRFRWYRHSGEFQRGKDAAGVKKIGNLIQPLIMGDQGEAAVIAFDHRIRILQEFTSDPDKITQRSRRFSLAALPTGWSTPWWRAPAC